MCKLKTTEQYIVDAKNVHGDKYDYSLVEYINNDTKITIICPIHGFFEQISGTHLYGSGCKKCSIEKFKKKQDDFIKDSKKIHNNKYDYSLVKYEKAHIKVKIICQTHGEFEQTPNSHTRGVGCDICGGTNKKTNDEFIEQSIKINDDKYDYSLCEYINDKVKVKLICKEHNHTFEVTPYSHLRSKYSCKFCNNRNHRLSKIKRANENRLSKYQISPLFNNKACKIFDEISKKENTHIQHAMNGGEYYIKDLGYWLDGYDQVNNIAYEYDERHHFREKNIIKDDIRQKEIEHFLKCKFIRIKDE